MLNAKKKCVFQIKLLGNSFTYNNLNEDQKQNFDLEMTTSTNDHWWKESVFSAGSVAGVQRNSYMSLS